MQGNAFCAKNCTRKNNPCKTFKGSTFLPRSCKKIYIYLAKFLRDICKKYNTSMSLARNLIQTRITSQDLEKLLRDSFKATIFFSIRQVFQLDCLIAFYCHFLPQISNNHFLRLSFSAMTFYHYLKLNLFQFSLEHSYVFSRRVFLLRKNARL